MHGWEYLVKWVGRPEEQFMEIQRRLDEYGADGWEWIFQTEAKSGDVWAYFKRPKQGYLALNEDDLGYIPVYVNPEHVEALKEEFAKMGLMAKP